MKKRISAVVAAGLASGVVCSGAVADVPPPGNAHNCAGSVASALVPPGAGPAVSGLAQALGPTAIPTTLGSLFNCGENGAP